jgi:NADPH:quinone reductase
MAIPGTFIRGPPGRCVRAVAVSAFGELPRLMELPQPSPGPTELLVRISAAGVNPFDAKIANGILQGRPHVFPLVLGVDAAGRVVRAGSEARRFLVGDRIFGQFLHDPVGTGTYAEFAVVPERNAVIPIPEGLSDREAAALPMAGMTARDALDRLELTAGSTLLVVGASGGIGSFVLPLARARGIRVIAVARTTAAGRVRSLGADEVVGAGLPDWPERVRALVPRGLDAALDLMSDASGFRRVLGLLRPDARAASTVYAAGSELPPVGPGHGFNIDLQPSAELLARVTREILERGIRVPVERTIALEEAPEALAEIRAGRAVGKTVVRVGDESGAP